VRITGFRGQRLNNINKPILSSLTDIKAEKKISAIHETAIDES